jgi:hypothetical protein
MTPIQAQTAELTGDASFFNSLMKNIMTGTMIPKVQIERAVGPLIGFFLADVLSPLQGQHIVMLCPEFPIKKMPLTRVTRDGEKTSRQSTNIDWLMFNVDRKELVLVELKTTDTTFKPSQAAIYEDLLASIKDRQSAKFLYEDIEEIRDASTEKGKYRYVLSMLEKLMPGGLPQLAACVNAQVIYLAPKASQPDNWADKYPGWAWLSFSDLPATITHQYAEQWRILRQSLLPLDALSRGVRNKSAA